MTEEPKPVKKRWIAAVAAAVGSAVTLLVENLHILEAISRFLNGIAR